MAKVNLKDVVDALEMQWDETESWFNPETADFIHLGPDQLMILGQLEDEEEIPEDDLPEWQKEELEQLRAFQACRETCIQLPDKSEIHEWRIMERFVDSLVDNRMKEDLQRAIHGRGAFRMFKDTAHRFGILNKWYAWREEAFREIALAWCEENNLEVGK